MISIFIFTLQEIKVYFLLSFWKYGVASSLWQSGGFSIITATVSASAPTIRWTWCQQHPPLYDVDGDDSGREEKPPKSFLFSKPIRLGSKPLEGLHKKVTVTDDEVWLERLLRQNWPWLRVQYCRPKRWFYTTKVGKKSGVSFQVPQGNFKSFGESDSLPGTARLPLEGSLIRGRFFEK